ncbi:MAG: hypothetical protein ABW123_26055 [Cystobacter sp.]
MRRSVQLLSSAVLAGLMLMAPRAEARFGKASSTTESEDSSRDRESDPGTHGASPVGDSPRRDRDDDRGRDRPRRSPRYEPRRSYSSPRPSSSGVYVDAPATYYVEPAPVAVAAPSAEYREQRSKNFLFGLDFQFLREGGGAALHLGFEGERLGLMFRAGGLSLATDDGSRGRDRISLLGTHLSYAVLKGERGRVRVEGGLSVASAPDVTFVGPSVGTSAEYYVFDSLAVEGRVHLTPFPYRQLDAAGGLAFYFFGDLFALRGGMRLLVLDDAGWAGGGVHRDVLPGPYLSVGLAI